MALPSELSIFGLMYLKETLVISGVMAPSCLGKSSNHHDTLTFFGSFSVSSK